MKTEKRQLAESGPIGNTLIVRMISAGLLKKYSAQPRPFTLHLADGRKIRVPHGDHISVKPDGRVLLLWKPRGEVEFINLTLVTSVAGPELKETS